MSYAALMVYVDIEGIPEQRVRIASELARKFDAALIGFSARAVPPPFVAEGVIIEEATEADIKQMQAALAKRGDWFRGIVGDVKDVEWRSALDFPGDALAREARCADLVIMGRQQQLRAAMTISESSIRARFFSSSAGPRCLLRRASPRCGPNMSWWPGRIPARHAGPCWMRSHFCVPPSAFRSSKSAPTTRGKARQPGSMTSSAIWRGTRSPQILEQLFIVTGLTRTICSSLPWMKELTCWWPAPTATAGWVNGSSAG